MDKPDYFQAIAIMMINQYKVSGSINVPLRTQTVCRNILIEQMVEMRKNGEDDSNMLKVLDKLTYGLVQEVIYGY